MKFSRALDFDLPSNNDDNKPDGHLRPTEKVYCPKCSTLMAVCGKKSLTYFCLNCECTDVFGNIVPFVKDKFCPVCRKRVSYVGTTKKLILEMP